MVDVERVFIHMVTMEVMQVAVMEIVGMAVMFDGAMAAVGSM